VQVEIGDDVSQDDVLIIFESMKMEIPLESPVAGRISELLVKPEDLVEEDQVVAVLDT
jgi:biotin carboxyl carrier protein